MDFVKYHGLGNDYIVIRQRALANLPLGAVAKALCDRHRGPGADGVLVDEGTNGTGERVVRIVNPDGSEAEKSGNGLRIFARFLWDTGEVALAPFSIRTVGGGGASHRCAGRRACDGGYGAGGFSDVARLDDP